MPLPDAPRVLYGNSPLVEVICQLCFPTILLTDRDLAAFQEKVRADFPFYQKKLPTVNRPPGATFAFGEDPPSNTVTHVYQSADKRWRLKLSQGLLSLTTLSYGRWEDFRSRLLSPVEIFAACFGQVFFNHICLRYRNVIRREQIGEKDTPWSELIEPWVSGPIGHPGLADGVETVFSKWLVKLSDGRSHTEGQCGLATEEPSKLKVFVVETHTYVTEQTAPSDATSCLDGINLHARRFFRSCITDRLHAALAPTDI